MNHSNQNITFKGSPVKIMGEGLKEGQMLPHFVLTGNDLGDLDSKTLVGKIIVLSVVPSLDTQICSLQTKRFNAEAEKFSKDVLVLTVSLDLPFAQVRWCGIENCQRIKTMSDYKYRSFGEATGTYIQDVGLLARAVFIVDKSSKVVYVEYVPEITKEPNYEAALSKLKSLA